MLQGKRTTGVPTLVVLSFGLFLLHNHLSDDGGHKLVHCWISIETWCYIG